MAGRRGRGRRYLTRGVGLKLNDLLSQGYVPIPSFVCAKCGLGFLRWHPSEAFGTYPVFPPRHVAFSRAQGLGVRGRGIIDRGEAEPKTHRVAQARDLATCAAPTSVYRPCESVDDFFVVRRRRAEAARGLDEVSELV